MTGHARPLNAFLDLPQVPVPHARIRAARRADAGRQGHFRRRRLRDRLRQSATSSRKPRPAERTAPAVQAAARCRRAIRRQDADRRACLLADGPERAFSAPGEPRRARPRHRRLVLGLGRGGRRRARRHRRRLRHRRLDPRAGELLRADRPAHHAWPHLARRRHAAGARRSTRSAGSPRTSRPTRRSAAVLLGADRASRASLTRPITHRRARRAGRSGRRRPRAYERPSRHGRPGDRRAAAGRVAVRQSTIDELYWCFRRLQAYEAWADRMATWITRRSRGARPRRRGALSRSARPSIATPRRMPRRRRAAIAFRAELAELLGEDGILVLPTVPGAAPLKSAHAPRRCRPIASGRCGCSAWSGLSGFPQITLPLGSVDGAPFGISLLGPPDSDIALIGSAPAFSSRRARLNGWTR